MKTNPIIKAETNNRNNRNNKANSNHQSFKGLGNGIVALMDGIERGGLTASFIIQDVGGSCVPRTYTGLHRNEDITGELNYTEAREVALREFITGPSMFVIPIGILYGIKKFIGKALDVPMKHIEVFSNILSKNSNIITETTIKKPQEFKTAYYKETFKNILSTSAKGLSEAEIEKNSTEFAQTLLKIESAKSKGIFNNIRNKSVPGCKEDLISELVEKFVDMNKSTNNNAVADFYTASISNGDKTVASAKIQKTLSLMTSYTDDILKKMNKNLKNFDESSVTNFVNKFSQSRVGGRFILNLGLLASVIAFCSVVPKFYMQSKTFPGMKGLEDKKANNETITKTEETQIPDKKTSKSKPSFGLSLAGFGDKIGKSNVLQKFGKIFECDGYNLPLASLTTICYGGVLLPRLVFARDKNEFNEILQRDIVSIGVLLFGRKAIQNVVSKACTKLSGIALSKLPQGNHGKLKAVWNYLRPEKGVSVLSSADLVSKYTHIDKYKDGISGFCDFVTKSGGNVAKLFKSDKQLADLAQKAYDASGVGGDFSKASSEKITEAFAKLKNNNSSELNGIYDYFKNPKNNILRKARIMNSSFDFLATFILVPATLGFALPKFTEKYIKNKYKNQENKIKTSNKVESNNTKIQNQKTEKTNKIFKTSV